MRQDAPEVNQQLAMDWDLEILRTARPVAVRSCQFSELRPWLITLGKSRIEFGGQSVREHEMTLLEYHIETAGQNCLLGALGNGPWHITLWFDGVTNLLERIDAVNITDVNDGAHEFIFTQAFVYSCPHISPPEEFQEVHG